MEIMKRNKLIHTSQLEVPELIQIIQSFLPVKDAARTSVLSKSWLRAWSTNPTLRFRVDNRFKGNQYRYMMNIIDRTLMRYFHENIPIESFDLHFGIHNHESACYAESRIAHVASNTRGTLKEIYLKIWLKTIDSFTLPDEIFYGENLSTVSVRFYSGFSDFLSARRINSLWIDNSLVIGCVSLRVLELIDVHISENVLQNLLSTCTLLEKINIVFCNTVTVNRLNRLRELKIISEGQDCFLEIGDVPSLGSFVYESPLVHQRKALELELYPWRQNMITGVTLEALHFGNPIAFNSDSYGSMKQLLLSGMIMDKTFLDTINSRFPFLESLTIEMERCSLEHVDITCVSLKRHKLSLHENKQIGVRVYATKLLLFQYEGVAIPSLLFPTVAPKEIELKLTLSSRVNTNFFIMMRKAFNLSSKFNVKL